MSRHKSERLQKEERGTLDESSVFGRYHYLRLPVLLMDCGKKERRLKSLDFPLQPLEISKHCLVKQKRDN